MRLDLLMEVAENTRRVPPKCWNMYFWLKHTACGTIGCAIGNARSLLERAGFVFEDHGSDGASPGGIGLPNKIAYIAEFFGIMEHDVQHLFSDLSYERGVVSSVVADRIEQFCRSHGWGIFPLDAARPSA